MTGRQKRRAWAAITLLLATQAALAIAVTNKTNPKSKITGHLLEGCSCSIPCACNFNQAPSPHGVCESLAFFELKDGELDGTPLRGIRFASATRGGFNAVIYIDNSLSEKQASAARRIASWVLSLESTPINATVRAPVNVEFEDSSLKGSVSGRVLSLTATPLRGNDGISKIIVTRPVIFGQFPVIASEKGIVKQLIVHAEGLSFEYQSTNANNATFEFAPSDVK